jgi:hypothetical protein
MVWRNFKFRLFQSFVLCLAYLTLVVPCLVPAFALYTFLDLAFALICSMIFFGTFATLPFPSAVFGDMAVLVAVEALRDL